MVQKTKIIMNINNIKRVMIIIKKVNQRFIRCYIQIIKMENTILRNKLYLGKCNQHRYLTIEFQVGEEAQLMKKNNQTHQVPLPTNLK
jgi:hypothetical protein